MTAPVALPPTCVLWIDGVRYADGQPAEAPDAPVALTGLQVTWGRDTTIDQPAPATCAFTVLDLPGGARFTATLRVGSRVQVRADAVIYPDPTIPTITDPGFETAAVGSAPSVVTSNTTTVRVSATQKHGGAHAARLEPLDGGRGLRVIFPPKPFTSDPAGWDTVPRTLPGQTWRYGAAVHVPAALAAVARAQVRPVAFTQPWAGSQVVATDAAVPGAPDGAGWVVHSALYSPPAGVWLGVAVDVYPTGPAWSDVPAAVTWASVAATVTWAELAATYVDDLVVLAPASGASRAGEVFTGRITDLAAEWDDTAGGTRVKVTAQDDTAELANRYVGDQPWSVESLGARFGRILTAAGQAMQSTVDPVPAARPVTYRDVDSRPAGDLLAELAQSAGGALWSATSLTTGPYLRLEDIDARPPLQTLAMDAGGVVRIVPAAMPGGHGLTISACDVLLDPIRWIQDVADVATRVAIGWKDQTVPNKPADRTETIINATAEAAIGRRRVQVSTQLSQQADALAVGNSLLGRLDATGWRISGLTYRVDSSELTPAGLAAVMTILDGTTRIGLPILLTDVPSWSPAPPPSTAPSVPLYLEGGRLTNDAGAWTLELVTAAAHATGAALVKWSSLPAAWTWAKWDPAIRWLDLAGVAPPP